MNKPKIKVRKAVREDSQALFAWRNDEQTRLVSRDSSLLLWQDHEAWFERTVASHASVLLICEDYSEGAKVGVVRFDRVGNDLEALISINLSPEMRGKGYAKDCLESAIDFFRKLDWPTQFILAEIKQSNEGSIRSFTGVGFVLAATEEEFSQYRYEL